MVENNRSHHSGHPMDVLLEDWILGRLPDTRAAEVQQMLEADEELAERAASLRNILSPLQQVLKNTGETEPLPLPDDLILARYLDNSLEEEERSRMEYVLSRSEKARARLAFLYRQLQSTLTGTDEQEMVDSYPEGETITLAESRAAQHHAEGEEAKTAMGSKAKLRDDDDGEKRKQRLSSGRS